MDTLLDLLTEIAIDMAIIIIPLLLAVLTRYIVRFLNAKMLELEQNGQEFELILLQEFARIAVQAAEQVLTDNGEKFTYAARQLVAFALSAGILLPEEKALALIESSVLAVKNELPIPLLEFIDMEDLEVEVERNGGL